MMAYDNCIREVSMKTLHQFTEHLHLLRSSGICRMTRRIQSALITDSNAILVMPLYMRTNLPQRSSVFHGTVAAHIFMVTYPLPTK
jgi:hypothetical protein